MCVGGWLGWPRGASLGVPTDRLDVVAGEHACLAMAASFPPVWVGVIQHLDEVAATEAELTLLLRVKVEECLHVCGMLMDLWWEKGRRERKERKEEELKWVHLHAEAQHL